MRPLIDLLRYGRPRCGTRLSGGRRLSVRPIESIQLGWRSGGRETLVHIPCRGARLLIDFPGHCDLTREEPSSSPVDVRRGGVLIQVLVHAGESDLSHLSLVQTLNTLRVQQHLDHLLQISNVVTQGLDLETKLFTCGVGLLQVNTELTDRRVTLGQLRLVVTNEAG